MADTSRISELTQQAESCLDRGDLAQARRLYAEICRTQDDDSHTWLMFGAINSELGNVEVALSALERAVALDANNAEAHLALAQLFRIKGQPEKAMACAARAVEADAELIEAWLFVAASAGQSADWPRAEEASRKIIALAPQHKEAHINLGNVLLATARFQEAEESYRKSLAIGESAEAWYGVGTALSALGRHADAEPALAAALRLNADNSGFRDALAACLERLGRAEESAAIRSGSNFQ